MKSNILHRIMLKLVQLTPEFVQIGSQAYILAIEHFMESQTDFFRVMAEHVFCIELSDQLLTGKYLETTVECHRLIEGDGQQSRSP